MRIERLLTTGILIGLPWISALANEPETPRNGPVHDSAMSETEKSVPPDQPIQASGGEGDAAQQPADSPATPASISSSVVGQIGLDRHADALRLPSERVGRRLDIADDPRFLGAFDMKEMVPVLSKLPVHVVLLFLDDTPSIKIRVRSEHNVAGILGVRIAF